MLPPVLEAALIPSALLVYLDSLSVKLTVLVITLVKCVAVRVCVLPLAVPPAISVITSNLSETS